MGRKPKNADVVSAGGDNAEAIFNEIGTQSAADLAAAATVIKQAEEPSHVVNNGPVGPHTVSPSLDPVVASSDAVGSTVRRLIDASQAVKREKQRRLLMERSELRVIDKLERGAIKAYDPLKQFDVASGALGLPKLDRASILGQLRDAFRAFVLDDKTSSYVDLVLNGRHSMKYLMTAIDYQRFHDTVRLPLGDLAHLTFSERERLLNVAQQVATRVASMSTLPLDDLDMISAAILSANGSDTSALVMIAEQQGLSTSGIDDLQLPQDERANMLSDILREAEKKARERFISTSLLQPLYRDVLVSTGDFRAPSAEAIADMAAMHASWEREVRLGAISTMIEESVTRHMGQNPYVSGLARLREATFGGVEQNAVVALSDISLALSSDPVMQGPLSNYAISGFSADTIGDSVGLACPLGRIERDVIIKDVLSQPAQLRDNFSGGAYVEDGDLATTITRMVLALSTLRGLKISSHVDLGFITQFPEWQGFISSEKRVSLADLCSAYPWFAARVVHDYHVALMNSTFVSSGVRQAFAKPNSSDAAKIYEEGLYYYALAQKVVADVIIQYLSAARGSFEMGHSPVWKELDSLGLDIPALEKPAFEVAYEATLQSSLPIVSTDGGSVSAARYYMDEEAARVAPGLFTTLSSLRSLGVLGDMKTKAHLSFPFVTGSSAPVDAYSAMELTDDNARLRRRLAQVAEISDATELNALAGRYRVAASAHVFEGVYSEDGRVIRGSYLRTAIPRAIHVVFRDLDRLEMLPLEEMFDWSALSDHDISLLTGRARALLVPVDTTPFFWQGSRTIDVSDGSVALFVPRDVRDLHSRITAWTHRLRSQVDDGGFVGEDPAYVPSEEAK